MTTDHARQLNNEAARRYRERHRERARAAALASYHKHNTKNVQKQQDRRRDQLEYILLWRAKHRAKTKNLPFDITVDDIQIPDVCPILGIKLARNVDGRTAADESPSLDRIIPALGYVRGNVRVISNRANSLKSNASVREMRLVLEDLERCELDHGLGPH